ncbi:hypothetical protein U0070_014241 [Myodes glareolus]|uniref:Protein yippee-like n=1 Tax=Myodes glareolus TaxID=447135 RepID=A0AAW0H7J4_MYOGA
MFKYAWSKPFFFLVKMLAAFKNHINMAIWDVTLGVVNLQTTDTSQLTLCSEHFDVQCCKCNLPIGTGSKLKCSHWDIGVEQLGIQKYRHVVEMLSGDLHISAEALVTLEMLF